MGFKSTCFFGVLAAALLLSGCSRESSIRENVTLRNNHSVVFASTHPFQNPEAFADSVTNLANPDSVLVPDTLTVTINDTIYMMGFLKHNADKIGRYYWILDSLAKDDKGKFSRKQAIRISNNASPISWVYPDTGLYSPLFVAIDGNNATDTAGADQFIRVINTPPTLVVPKDTLWTKHKVPLTFPIFARDSFGTIVSVKVDLDAGKKKASPKKWDFKTKEDNDSLFITIPRDSNYVDSIGNQTIYVIIADDDGNEVTDSVYIHFNQLPKLELQYPEDKMRVDKNSRFAFYYQAKDVDNPGAVRYFIRAAKTRDNGNDAPVLNDGDLIAKNLTEKSFEAVTPDGKNLIGLEGRIYWDVWVTDGYDTVYADKITDNGVTRPRSFFLGNPDATTGRFIGFANLQGMSPNNHTGIRIVFQDTEGNRYYGHNLKDNGYFYVDVPEGTYEMIAMDTLGRGFASYQEQDLFIEVDDTRDLGKIILKDSIRPVIRFVEDIDTLTGRSVVFAGKFTDKGSQVKTASAWFDGAVQEFSNFTISSWSVDLNDMVDGEHLFKLVAQDSAGNTSDTLKVKFYVAATNIKLTVDGKASSMTNDKLAFKVSVAGANPPVDSIEWKPNIQNAKKFKSKISSESASLTLTEADFNSTFGVTIKKDSIYEMQVITSQGTPSNKVRFGYFDDNPVVYFEKPGSDTTITINDVIEVSVIALGNNVDKSSSYKQLQWNCGANATGCPANMTTSGNVSWSKTGDYALTVSITNNDDKSDSDILNVHVVSDLPIVRITTDEDTIRAKINSDIEIPITAKDKFGTIETIKATCGANTFPSAAFSPAKEVSTSIMVTLPSTESHNYKCIVQATDDDGESAKDTLVFQVLSGKPTVSLNIKSQTLTILDRVPMNFVAEDSIGEIVMYEYGCNSTKKNIESSMKQFDGSVPTLTMPNTAGAYYCAIRVTDDDNNTASDTATYNVLLDPPTVQTQGPYSVTIKDELNLDAIASDQYGKIVKYEWGCGPASAGNIGFTHTSTSSPQYKTTMPSIAQNNYRCVIRVTDDDGNAASDTVSINVLLAPPTVTVANETAIIRQGYNIVLDAEAHDYPNYQGEIVKREWSCGATTNLIEANWKTVSSYDTVWKAPAAVAKLYCIARATDDDGNIAMDTMTCTYSTDVPVITVREDTIYAVPGDVLTLGADTNSVWQGINWYNWQCFDKATKKALDTFTKLDYKSNYQQVTNWNKSHTDKLPYFYETRDLPDNSKSMYCVLRAEESSTKAEFSDTTYVNVITQSQKPVGVLSVADTIYPRSGNIAQTGEALYFYTNDWGGYNSVNGVIGSNNTRDFWWRFGTLGGDYYQGLASGKLDTNIAQFNTAFIRPTEETQFDVCLDFRDSTKESATQAFLSRHQADEVCKTIYVRKAWQNLAGNDTVLEYNNKTAIPPAITSVGTKLVAVYATGSSTLHSKYFNGSTWSSLTVPEITGSIKEIKLVSNGSAAYLAVLTSEKNLTIYQSNSGTSPWATYGTTIANVTAMDITCKSAGIPIVSYIKDSKPNFSYLSGSTWTTKKISDNASQEIKAIFAGDNLVFVYIKNNFDYTAYYAIYNSSYTQKTVNQNIGKNIKGVSLAADGTTLYMAFLNQDVENMKTGPYMYKGTVSATNISWTNGSGFNTNIVPGTISYNIRVAVNNGKVLVAFDDNFYSYAQSHVYYHDGTGWSPYGETDLPYFYSQFIKTHGYYLRGYSPTLSISSDGKTYLSMLGWENAGGSGRNFGAIVMKYAADSWTVKDFRN